MLRELLVRTFVPAPKEIGNPRVREAYGVLEGWVSIVVNLVVFAVKIVPGVMIGSIALIADAIHSLGDIVTSVVVIWGFKVSNAPPDREHPFGHGRAENIASLVIAVLLFLTAWEFGKASVARLLHPRQVEAGAWLLALLALSIVLKEWLSQFSLALGRTINSTALIGDFWHHRSDVLATAIVAVALVASTLGWWWVDGLGGLAVSAIIAWAAWRLLGDSLTPLIGEAPSAQLLTELRAIALGVPEVDEVHDVIVHRYGGLLVSSLHIEVSDAVPLSRSHDIAEAVEQQINERFGGWAVVHVDPVNRAHPLYPEVGAFLSSHLPTLDPEASFHDLRIVGGAGDPSYVIFDLKAEPGEQSRLAVRLRQDLLARFAGVAKVVVNIEPRYVY